MISAEQKLASFLLAGSTWFYFSVNPFPTLTMETATSFILILAVNMLLTILTTLLLIFVCLLVGNCFHKWLSVKELAISLNGDDSTKFYTGSGTLIAIGYQRVIITAERTAIEFSMNQLVTDNIHFKYKRLWLESKDKSCVWIMDAMNIMGGTPGAYCIFADDLFLDNGKRLYKYSGLGTAEIIRKG